MATTKKAEPAEPTPPMVHVGGFAQVEHIIPAEPAEPPAEDTKDTE